jgi:hypothetical protein
MLNEIVVAIVRAAVQAAHGYEDNHTKRDNFLHA